MQSPTKAVTASEARGAFGACNPGIILRQEHSLQRAALHLGRGKKLPLLRDQSIVTAGLISWLFEKVKSR